MKTSNRINNKFGLKQTLVLAGFIALVPAIVICGILAAQSGDNPAMSDVLKWGLITLGICMVVLIMLASKVVRQVLRPMAKLVPVMKAAAKGEIHEDYQKIEVKSNDEIGELAKAIIEIIDYTEEIVKAINKMTDEADYVVKVRVRSENDILGKAFSKKILTESQILKGFKEHGEMLADAGKQLTIAAEQAGQATQGIASTTQQISKGAGDQSQNVQATTASMQQLSKAIDQIAHGAQEQAKSAQMAATIVDQVSAASTQVANSAQAATEGSREASMAAVKGAEMVNKTIEGTRKIKEAMGVVSKKVTDLGERSNEIGKIVATIDDIAAQTNLLALNAAIEAARAGEQGRGFAVVADEVRKLAERSSMATKEIADLITGIQKGVSEAVKAMGEGDKEIETGNKLAADAGESLQTILNITTDVSTRIEQISAASKELSDSANEMVKTIDSVSSVVEENTAATEEMAANSSEVTRALENVAGISEQNSAATQEISASAEEMSAQVEQVIASARSLSETARGLADMFGGFKISDDVG